MRSYLRWMAAGVAVVAIAIAAAGVAAAEEQPLVIEQGRVTMGNIVESERPVYIVGTVLGNVSAPSLVVDQSGLVFGNLTATGRPPEGTVRVAGRVVGTVSGHDVTLVSTARVTGNISTSGELTIQPGAHHTGVTDRPRSSTIHIGPFAFDASDHDAVHFPQMTRWPTIVTSRSPFGWLPAGLGVLALSVLLFAMAPEFVNDLAQAASGRPWKSLGIGFLSLLLLVPGLLVLVITLVGILLVPAVLVGYVGLGISGFAGIAWWLGRRLVPDGPAPRQFWQLLAGGGLLVLGQQVPVAGGLVAFAVTLVGLGAAFTVLGDRWQRRRQRARAQLKPEQEPEQGE